MIKRVKIFWENRAEEYSKSDSFSITNLEEDNELQKIKIRKEKEKILNVIELTKETMLLDLGSGIGYWSLLFAPKCKKVIGVDFIERMNIIASKRAKEENIKNVEFITSDIINFKTRINFDYVFLSGVLLYLGDSNANLLINSINDHTKKNAMIVVRDSTGMNGRFEIKDKYSEDLQATYNAIYRSKTELIDLFSLQGFSLVYDDDMFDNDSPLNKWHETRLRIYVFQKNN